MPRRVATALALSVAIGPRARRDPCGSRRHVCRARWMGAVQSRSDGAGGSRGHVARRRGSASGIARDRSTADRLGILGLPRSRDRLRHDCPCLGGRGPGCNLGLIRRSGGRGADMIWDYLGFRAPATNRPARDGGHRVARAAARERNRRHVGAPTRPSEVSGTRGACASRAAGARVDARRSRRSTAAVRRRRPGPSSAGAGRPRARRGRARAPTSVAAPSTSGACRRATGADEQHRERGDHRDHDAGRVVVCDAERGGRAESENDRGAEGRPRRCRTGDPHDDAERERGDRGGQGVRLDERDVAGAEPRPGRGECGRERRRVRTTTRSDRSAASVSSTAVTVNAAASQSSDTAAIAIPHPRPTAPTDSTVRALDHESSEPDGTGRDRDARDARDREARRAATGAGRRQSRPPRSLSRHP